LLGAIRCYRALGETEQARLATEEILRRFADTPEASTASKGRAEVMGDESRDHRDRPSNPYSP
jgi:hypothetical protein